MQAAHECKSPDSYVMQYAKYCGQLGFLPIIFSITIFRMDSTLYWLVHEPFVPLSVKASMQIDPPAVTCPAPFDCD